MADRQWSPLIVPTTFVAGAAILLYLLGANASIDLNDELEWQDYSSLFTNLLFVALLAERFIEVFVGVARMEGKSRRQLEIDHATPTEKKAAEMELDVYRAGTAKAAMQIAFVVGLVSSIAGLRTLQIVFDASGLEGVQEFLFALVDIVLTAGVIAGGSSGINQITALFSAHFQTQAKNARTIGTPPRGTVADAPAQPGSASPPPRAS